MHEAGQCVYLFTSLVTFSLTHLHVCALVSFGQAQLLTLLPQLLIAVAAAVDIALASQLNPKVQSIPWASIVCTWERDGAGGYQDAVHKGRMCLQHVLAGLEVSKDAYSYHYAGDKGWAG